MARLGLPYLCEVIFASGCFFSRDFEPIRARFRMVVSSEKKSRPRAESGSFALIPPS